MNRHVIELALDALICSAPRVRDDQQAHAMSRHKEAIRLLIAELHQHEDDVAQQETLHRRMRELEAQVFGGFTY